MKDRTALVASFLLDRGIEQSRVQEALERGQSGIKKTSNAYTSFPYNKNRLCSKTCGIDKKVKKSQEKKMYSGIQSDFL